MVLFLCLIFWILCIVMFFLSCSYIVNEVYERLTMVFFIMALVVSIFGLFHGMINRPETKGIHQGVITAVDLEGVYFRRYEVYLRSYGEHGETGKSDETKYLLYAYEEELAEELKDSIGKTVKLHYGHDGGYIGWRSCGTLHIKSFEVVE